MNPILNEFSKMWAIGLGTNELLIILVLILVLFGGSQIPKLMRGVGQGIGELQKGIDDGKKALDTAIKDTESESKTS